MIIRTERGRALIAGLTLAALAGLPQMAWAETLDETGSVVEDVEITVDPQDEVVFDEGTDMDFAGGDEGVIEDDGTVYPSEPEVVYLEDGEEAFPVAVEDGEVVVFDDGACINCNTAGGVYASAGPEAVTPFDMQIPSAGRMSRAERAEIAARREADNACNHAWFDIAAICDPWRARQSQ